MSKILNTNQIEEEKPKRKTKGIWIPIEIWEHKELTLQEKVFLAEIDSLDNDQGCWASNAYFSEHFGLSKNRISIVISSLVEKKFITNQLIYKENSKEIYRRILRVTSSLYPTNPSPPIPGNANTPSLRKRNEGIPGNANTPIPGNAKDNNLSFNNPEEQSLKDIGETASQSTPPPIDKQNLSMEVSKKQIIQKKAERILAHFNKLRNEFRQKHNLKKSSGFSPTQENLKPIIAILNKKKTYKECIQVLENKIQDEEFVFKDWYNPETLFRAIKFQKYLDYDPTQYKKQSSTNKPSNGSGYTGTRKYKEAIKIKNIFTPIED